MRKQVGVGARTRVDMPVTPSDCSPTVIECAVQNGSTLRFIIGTDVNNNPIVDIHVAIPDRHAPEFLGTIYCAKTFAETSIKSVLNKKYVQLVRED